MITYPEAISLINKISLKLQNEKISILDSVNRICAENLLSPTTNPSSNNSAFDGFAVIAKETEGLLPQKQKNLKS